jgi:preprotein translocase subunit SecD
MRPRLAIFAATSILAFYTIWLVRTQDGTVQAAESTKSPTPNIQAAEKTATPEILNTAIPGSQDNPYLNPCTGEPFHTVLTGDAIETAQAQLDSFSGSQYVVAFTLRPDHAGTTAFAQYTAANIGKPLAIVLDGEVLTAPVIQAALTDSGTIQGNFTQENAKTLAAQLRSGALPAPVTLESVEETDDSIEAVFTVDVNANVSPAILSEIQRVMKRRLEELGVVEPVVDIVGEKIAVRLPKIRDDPLLFLTAIQKSGLLEFVDFSDVCSEPMPIDGMYILTDVQVARREMLSATPDSR